CSSVILSESERSLSVATDPSLSLRMTKRDGLFFEIYWPCGHPALLETLRINSMQNTTQDEALNPFPRYRIMREEQPVYFNPQYRFWQVYRYEDVQRVLSDYASFSSGFGGDQGRDPLSASMISMDPPRHRQLRNLVTQAFTPRGIAQLSDRITTIVNTLLDEVAARGHMDIIDDLSYQLPVIVITE